MSLLDKMWDDTVAGPQPESGLSRLRKHHLCTTGSRTAGTEPAAWDAEEERRVSQPIAISKTANFGRNLTVDTGSTPSSPAGSSVPESPNFCWTPRGSWNKFSRKSMDEGQRTLERAEPRSPTVYDWIVISALDR